MWIADRFRAGGIERIRIEEERAHGGFWWPVGLLNVLGIAGALLRRRAVSLLATALLVDDVDGRARAFRSLLPKRATYNVTAETGDPDAERTIVIVAHHDAAHGGAIFDTTLVEAFAARFPGLLAKQKRWPPMMWGTVLGPLFGVLGMRRISAIWSAGAMLAMADIGRTPVVPGANDNATAVAAVLELAKRDYEGIRVLLVSTGSEESNAEGMRAWGRRHFPHLPRERTEFVALETLGSGHLAVAEGEGFLVTYGYDAALKDAAMAAAGTAGVETGRGLVNSFISDAIVPLQAGYPTIMLGAIDDLKLPSNYHKPTDTPDRIDYTSVADAVELLDALIRARAESEGCKKGPRPLSCASHPANQQTKEPGTSRALEELAGDAKRSVDRRGRRLGQPLRRRHDVGDPQTELLVDHDDLALGDDLAVDQQVDGLARQPVQRHDRPGRQRQRLADRHGRAADLDGQLDGNVDHATEVGATRRNGGGRRGQRLELNLALGGCGVHGFHSLDGIHAEAHLY